MNVNGDPLKRALPVLVAVCVAIALVTAVYFIAQYQSEAEVDPATAFTNPTWNTNFAAAEPIEAGGIEGVLTSQGFLVTGLDGRSRGLGLQIGDTILTVGKQPLRSELQVRALAPGVTLRVDRAGESTTVKLGGAAALAPVDARVIDVRGVTGQLTPEGLWVTSVEGNASAWGLRTGDLVRTVDGHPLTVRRDVTSLVRNLNPANGFVFEIVRDGARIYLPYNTQPRPGPASMAAANQMPQNFNMQRALPGARAGLQAVTGASPMINGSTQMWAGAATYPGAACRICGTWHGPGMHRGTCRRCGTPLPVAPQRPQLGAGTRWSSPPRTSAAGQCANVPQNGNGGW